MTVIMHNYRENDYSVICNNCGSEEICDHKYRIGADLESVDFCEDCCSKCETGN